MTDRLKQVDREISDLREAEKKFMNPVEENRLNKLERLLWEMRFSLQSFIVNRKYDRENGLEELVRLMYSIFEETI